MPRRQLLISSSCVLRKARMPTESFDWRPVARVLSGRSRDATSCMVGRTNPINQSGVVATSRALSALMSPPSASAMKYRRRSQNQNSLYHPLSKHVNTTLRWFASSPSPPEKSNSETEKEAQSKESTPNASKKTQPKGITKFPWYHSEDVLPRADLELRINDRVRSTLRGRISRFSWQVLTAYMMGKSPWESLVGLKAWKEEIAENGAWAFGTGMAALWSNVFQVPMDGMISEDEDGDLMIQFEFDTTKSPPLTKPTTKTPTTTNVTSEKIETADDDDSNPATTTEVGDKEEDNGGGIATDDQVNKLFGKHFIQIYKDYYNKISSDNSDTNFKVKVELTPFRTEMVKIGTLPFFSRAVLEENPTFRKEFFDMFSLVRTHGFQVFLDSWMDFANKMTDERGIFMESTVTADILVDCVETFSVQEYPPKEAGGKAATPSLVQGDNVERTVRHLLRMELDFGAEFDNDFDTQNNSSDDLRWYTTNWRIVDVDDLMDPKGEWLIPMPPSLADKKK